MLTAPVLRPLVAKEPFLWLNTLWLPMAQTQVRTQLADVLDAERRLAQFAGLLAALFPELAAQGGMIESPLLAADALQRALQTRSPDVVSGRWFIKADHALPVAGSIKARGGIYEVLLHAESVALRESIIAPTDDRVLLASPRARELFGHHEIVVGSTGNLGLSIGIMAAALGFRARVHMSADAKQWKKERLRSHGVEVVKHSGDFGAAVAAGRLETQGNPRAYFVDDENSLRLLLGYSVAAPRLRQQLAECGVVVDRRHPLFIYIPCGVGGAPGGITLGLRHLFGDDVHCFLAEPVSSACLLVRLAAGRRLSVRDVGLDNRTDADGLAVGQASELAAEQIRNLVAGIFTVPEEAFFEDLYVLQRTMGLRVEPSAVAGFRGPHWVLGTPVGREYLDRHGLQSALRDATHVLWTTGGAFLPDAEYRAFHDRGRALAERAGAPSPHS